MIYLVINTAVSLSSVVLIENNQIISTCEEYNSKDLSSKIFFMIDHVFRESNYSPRNINKIFVVNGPGSFTGIRIGLAIAKTMAWALKIDLIPISCLQLLSTTSTNKKNNIALIDARRNFVYAGGYDAHLDNIVPDQYINISKLQNLCSKLDVCYISYDSFENIQSEKPIIDYVKIVKKHENDVALDCHKINPMYLKMTEAEEKRDEH